MLPHYEYQEVFVIVCHIQKVENSVKTVTTI